MSTQPSLPGLEDRATRLRIHSIRATTAAGSGHPTSCCSAAVLVAALFFDVMRFRPAEPHAPDNDRMILSKGHAAPLLYAAWAEAGALSPDELLTLRRLDSDLEGHPTPRLPFVEAATGSLGQGLSVGVGMALGRKLDDAPGAIFVLLGDGECAEGNVWEAAANKAVASLEAQLHNVKLPPVHPPQGPPAPAAPRAEITDGFRVSTHEKGTTVATRQAYGEALAKLGKLNPAVVALDGDVKNSTHAELFKKACPERYVEGFIAEQNMVATAVGLAAYGKIPFVSTFACFLTRAFDQIRMAAISRANVKFSGSHCGVSIGEDGPSQMGLEDLAMFRVIPGSVILYPADAVSTERCVELAAGTRGIVYIRTTRPKTPVLYDPDEAFAVGGLKVLRQSEGDRVTVVAAGVTLHEALKAHAELNGQGIAIRIIDLYSVKPLDRESLLAAARATGGRLITVEDHYSQGGLGDAVLEAVAGEGSQVQ